MADFDAECSHAAMSSSSMSDIVPVALVVLLSETSWFVSAEVVDQGVVESPELWVANVLRRAGSSFGYIPGRRPVGDT